MEPRVFGLINNAHSPATQLFQDAVVRDCYTFPREHWRSLRTNNPLDRLREVRRRTRAVGAFPDGKSALMYLIKTS